MLKPPAQSAGLDHSPHYFMATLTRAGGNLQSEKEKSKKKNFCTQTIYSLWIQTLSETVLNPPNHTPNTSQEGTWINRD